MARLWLQQWRNLDGKLRAQLCGWDMCKSLEQNHLSTQAAFEVVNESATGTVLTINGRRWGRVK